AIGSSVGRHAHLWLGPNDPSRCHWGGRSISVSGGCGGFDHVPDRIYESDGESGHLAGVVAALAEAAAVRVGGGSAVGKGLDVVEVADRGVAVGVAALLVAVDQQPGERAVEPAAPRVAVSNHAGGRISK